MKKRVSEDYCWVPLLRACYENLLLSTYAMVTEAGQTAFLRRVTG